MTEAARSLTYETLEPCEWSWDCDACGEPLTGHAYAFQYGSILSYYCRQCLRIFHDAVSEGVLRKD